MRILQLCNKPPLPAVDGGCKAMLQGIDVFQKLGYSVDVFCISTPKHPFIAEAIPAVFSASVDMQYAFINTAISPVKILTTYFSKVPYLVQRFFETSAEKILIDLLQKKTYDIILFESIYTCEYLSCVQKYSNAKFILRSHNIEYLLWETRAKEMKNLMKKIYLMRLSKSLRDYEFACMRKIKNVLTISCDDASFVTKNLPNIHIFNLPFLVQDTVIQPQKTSPTFYHLGAMDWQPNIDAVEFILHELVPSLNQQQINFSLHIGGRNMPTNLATINLKGVCVHANVEDALQFISEHDVLVAPVFSGGGLRIKMIEALQLGKVIITTRLGASGIPLHYQNEDCLLLAETKEEFLTQIYRCLTDRQLRERISKNAAEMVQHEFHFNSKSKELLAYLPMLV